MTHYPITKNMAFAMSFAIIMHLATFSLIL